MKNLKPHFLANVGYNDVTWSILSLLVVFIRQFKIFLFLERIEHTELK